MADITILNLNMFYMRYVEGEDRVLHMPLGPLYVTSALEEAGFDVDFRDYQAHESPEFFSGEEIVRFLDDPAPVVGFTCMTNLLPFTLLAMREFKDAWPDRTLVLAGVGPVTVERKILERFPWVDVIVRGEAETSTPLLLEALEHGRDLSHVPGVSFRRGGLIVHTPRPCRLRDLDSIPWPAYHHVDLARFDGFGIITSRGCPYGCRFCSVASMWDHRATYRSVESVVEEMRMLDRTAGADLFLIQDDLFVTSKARIMSFCEALRRSGLDVRWKAMARVDTVDEELLRTMAQAGCIDLRFGIESGADGVLTEIKKGFKGTRTIDVVRMACELIREVHLFYIWGFPFETMEDFHQTVFQMISFRMMGAHIVPLLFCRLPQTEMCDEDLEGLELAPDLMPESLTSGIEVYRGSHIEIRPEHRHIFDFIRSHPDIFTGFFVRDLDSNIRPKLRVMQEHGFYPVSGGERTTTWQATARW